MTTITLDGSLQEVTRSYQTDLAQSLASVLSYRYNSERDMQYKPVDPMAKSNLYNKGFVGLLSQAYSNHVKIAIAPDDIWIVLMSELAKEVNANTEYYRPLFTKSSGREMITVPSGSMTHMPIDVLSKAVSDKVLFSSTVLFPEFSTETAETRMVKQAIFCDMAGAYYDYGMFCCGIPAVKLLGTKQDWQNMVGAWDEVAGVFAPYGDNLSAYFQEVSALLKQMAQSWDDAQGSQNFWKGIFTQENVGSGGDLTIDGWVTKLFVTKHSFAKITNFTSTHGVVKYKQLDTEKQYAAVCGAFDAQKDEEGFLKLVYGQYVFELVKRESRY